VLKRRPRRACGFAEVRNRTACVLGRSRFPVVGLMLVLTACGGENESVGQPAELPLFGGQESSRCDWTNVVSLDGKCSGVAVHPQLVLYAAHCGIGISRVSAESQSADVEYCRAYPNWSLGGSDLAYCKLKSALVVDTVPQVMGCERAVEREGEPVTLVGYGPAAEDGQFGVRRRSDGSILRVDDTEIVVGGAGVGLCSGDSGGPLFVSVDDGGKPSLRLVGVASATPTGPCGEAESHYVRLSGYWPWLEQESGLDLTPCGAADGSWSPTAACTAPRLDSGSCMEHTGQELSQSCGAAFSTAVPDEQPPTLKVVAPADNAVFTLSAAHTASIQISLQAEDSGWGLRDVRARIIDKSGLLVWSGIRSFPKYDFEPPPFGAEGEYRLQVAAYDYAGRSTTLEQRLQLRAAEAASCSVSAVGHVHGSTKLVLFAIMGCLVGWRKRRCRH